VVPYSHPASEEAYVAHPIDSIGGTVTVPGDKSISHRALLMGGIASGNTTISGFLRSEDCLATLAAIRSMGVTVADTGDELTITGAGPDGLQQPAGPLDLGNSGTAMRLLLGVLAAQPFTATLTGDASLLQRPMERVAGPLREMGASIDTDQGTAPLTVLGARPLRPIEYSLPVASAQLKSAILLAGLWANGRTTVTSPGPSRDHTERMLETMGVDLERNAPHSVTLAGPVTLAGQEIAVPADFSSAAFFIVAGLLAAEEGMTIPAVGVNPSRTGLLKILGNMGARIELRNEQLWGAEPIADIVVTRSELHATEIGPELVDLSIDELPIAFIAAAAARGCTRISGAAELRHKESDRIRVMAEGLSTVGIDVRERPDGLDIEGGEIKGGRIDSAGDHRVAMAFAIASCRASEPIEILDTGPVATSFPDFLTVASRIGFQIERLSWPASG
jgi:3-phosphoshikimate 1-carboxyvinyltransferase